MSSGPAQPRIVRLFERLPLVAGVTVALAALAALAMWETAASLPGARPYAGGFVMLPVTCVAFLLAGTSLAIMAQPARARSPRIVAAVLSALVLVIALLEAASWAAGRNLGLDLVLFPEVIRRMPWEPPGRIAINSVVAFLFAGTALIALHADDRDGGSSAQRFALVTAVIAFLALVGYGFGASRLYAPRTYNGMALSTAVWLFVLGVGIMFARRTAGLPALLVDSGAAGSVARRLVPAAILVPVFLGWVRMLGERAGFYGPTVGASVYVVATVAIFLWLVWWAARMARASDDVRAALLERERAARTTAEDANAAKSNFLAVMSHELRTPLAAIIGYEELLADGITGPVNEAQKHQLGRMKASAQHLLHLIDQILSYSRMDAGREVARADDVDADEMVHEAANVIEPLAAEKGLTLRVIPIGYAVAMRTDAGKVRQILVNLLSNAVKFTTEGEVRITVRHDGGIVRYEVSDTGIGIAPEHLERIFEPFWQVEQPSTRRAGGTGLGLAVTRRLVHLLGGDLAVRSVPGDGTTFTVTIPLEPRAPAAA